MFNKKRLVVFVVFLLLMFFMITFAGSPTQNQAIKTRLVTFIDSFNDEIISEQKVEVGKDAEVPEDPYHKNYVFAGWYLEEDDDVRVTDFTNILEDLSVVAKYEDDKNNNGIADDEDEYFTVTFYDTIAKKNIKKQEVLSGMNAKAPKVPVHAGYTFTGWSRGYTKVTKDITVQTTYVKNVKVIERYTVTFVDGDTKEVIKEEKVQKGLAATLPEAPKHEKRVFDHWEGDYENVTDDVTVTAIYKDDINSNEIPDDLDPHYTIEFVAGDNGTLDGTLKYENVLTDLTFEEAGITVPTPVANENYIFDEWTPEIDETVTGGVVYTAVFAPDFNHNEKDDNDEDHYTIEFVAGENGKLEGTLKYENVLVDLTFEEAGIIIPTPVADENYIFNEWDEEIATTVTKNATYTAVFAPDFNKNEKDDTTEEHYTIEFVAGENGKLEGTLKYENVLVDLTFEQAGITIPTTMPDENYIFNGWEPTVVETVTSNQVYTAKFAPDFNKNEKDDTTEEHYTIEFVAGENGSLKEEILKYENILTGLTFEQAGITIPTPVANENYIFNGWEPTVVETVTSNQVYTAKFAPDFNKNEKDDTTEDHFTVKFIAGENGKLEGTTEYKNILTGLNFYDEVAVPKAVANDGYTFDKWDKELPSEDAKVTEDLTYTAIFAEDKNNNDIPDYKEGHYTIEFVAGENGKLEGTLKYENILVDLTFEEAGITIPTIVPNKDYIFDGWSPELVETVTGKQTYTANFAPDFNGNGKDDRDEEKVTIEFVAGENGKLEGTLKYENVLPGLTFEKAGIIIPTPVANENYIFNGWMPSEPTKDTKTSKEGVTYTANFAPDFNGNGKDDTKEDHFTVKFVAGENGKLEGTKEFKEILTGLKFYDEVEVPTPVANEGYTFDTWSPVLPEKDSKVTGDLTYTAKFAVDKNGNNIPDEDEEKVTIEFVAGSNGKLEGTLKYENVLPGLTFEKAGIIIPTPVANENYIFNGWMPSEPTKDTKTSKEGVTYTANFAPDFNGNGKDDTKEDHFTVKFVAGENGKLEGTKEFKEILTGLKFYDEVEVPTPVANEGYTFDTWSPVLPEKDSKVTGDLTYTAKFAVDKNGNNIPDEDEEKVTIEFVAGENGKLEGTLKYENVLPGLTFEKAGIIIPTPVANENYIFNGWMPSEPTKDTKTSKEGVTYTANFAPDFNGNGKDDTKEDHFTVKFVAGENGKLEGTKEFKEILTGLKFYDEVEVPTPAANEGYTFDTWTPVLPEKDAKVTEDLTYTAKFAVDKNGNNIPDEDEEKTTVEFVAGSNGKLEGTLKYENVLPGLTFEKAGIIIPTPVANENYIFNGWMPSEPTKDTKTSKEGVTYTANFAPDFNGNGKDDTTENHYTIKFEAGKNGTLEGTLEYKDILVDLTFEKAGIIIPTYKANEGYVFDKWTPSEPTNSTKVTGEKTFVAEFAIDENGNGTPDYKENKYTITYDKNIATTGNVPVDGIEYVKGKGYTVLDNTGLLDLENAVFVGWSTEAKALLTAKDDTIILPGTKGTIGEENITLYAVFAEDKNNNDNPDYLDNKYTVTFKNEDGTVLKTQENILEGLSATAPADPTKAKTQQYTYTFAGWDKDFSEVKENMTVTATYTSTVNQYTVTFKDYDGTVLGTSTVDYGTSATSPADPARINYTFTGWDKAFSEVKENMIVTATYEANVISIRAEEKANAQLQFQVGSTDDIKNHINVYKVFADGTEELLTSSEYTTDFTTESVATDKKLTITLTANTSLKDNSLTYDITERPAYPTKFEVIFNSSKTYRKTSSSYCSENCDSTNKTTAVTVNYNFLEVIEHYDENISVSSIKANYTNGTSEKLYVSDTVRWSSSSYYSTYDPVRIASRGTRNSKQDVMTSDLVIDTLEITYVKGYSETYTITFEYNATTQTFKSISEVQH